MSRKPLAVSIDYSIFDSFSAKTVTTTDMSKGAYVLTKGQVSLLAVAGRAPSHDDPFDVTVLFDASRKTAKASFYYSARGTDAGRRPEPRMGREIVTGWMNKGDSVVLARIGSEVIAFKESVVAPEADSLIESFARRHPARVLALALKSRKAAKFVRAERKVYCRSPWVVAAALLRADGKCEMPECSASPILRDDGSNYLEVHHIDPLSNGGSDSLQNVASLCPRCHRLLHHGQNRNDASKRLAKEVERKTGEFVGR